MCLGFPNLIFCFQNVTNLVIPGIPENFIITYLFLLLQNTCKIQDEYQINRSFVDMYGGCYYGGTIIRYKLENISFIIIPVSLF